MVHNVVSSLTMTKLINIFMKNENDTWLLGSYGSVMVMRFQNVCLPVSTLVPEYYCLHYASCTPTGSPQSIQYTCTEHEDW